MDQHEMEEEGLLPPAPTNLRTQISEKGEAQISFISADPTTKEAVPVQYMVTAFVSHIHSHIVSTETAITLPDLVHPGEFYSFEVTVSV